MKIAKCMPKREQVLSNSGVISEHQSRGRCCGYFCREMCEFVVGAAAAPGFVMGGCRRISPERPAGGVGGANDILGIYSKPTNDVPARQLWPTGGKHGQMLPNSVTLWPSKLTPTGQRLVELGGQHMKVEENMLRGASVEYFWSDFGAPLSRPLWRGMFRENSEYLLAPPL